MSDYTIETAPPIVDGMVHLTYYIRDAQLSFVWSGRITEPIHVQHGGYGEATVALIDPAPDYPAGEKSPVELFDWYRNLCDRWNLAWDGIPDVPTATGDYAGVEQIEPGVFVVRI
ncbi:hypothetical protein [Nocardioides luteus]|uniref:hypothetical protein n=1 Tax=Nocardioides luteus TaxID=1844 RepID=UPI0018C9418F|nr:hypothetical protein [Nocardioides luteus]MBG6099069.1 hypothetical protein [Nocardioides luteus]